MLLQVAVQPQHNVKLTWMFSCDILCRYVSLKTASQLHTHNPNEYYYSYDVTVTASDKTVPRKHNRSTRGKKGEYIIVTFKVIKTFSAATPRTQSSPYILLANRYFLHQLTLDGNREKTVVSDPRGNIYAVDYHYR